MKNTTNKFQRSDKTIRKQILIDAIESEVVRDATLSCSYDGHVYYEDTNGLFKVQFPKSLRIWGAYYTADIYKRTTKSGTVFWSAYKGTIRNAKGEVVA